MSDRLETLGIEDRTQGRIRHKTSIIAARQV